FADLDTVTQQHCRASDANVHLMQAFGIRPVVLVRNIFDSVMSLLDFYNKGAFQTSYFRADWQALDEELKIDLLIENVIPSDVVARARALRRVAENSTLAQQEFNRAFVLMQYFGYLRRNPNDAPDSDFAGFNFWLNKLNQANGSYIDAEMVKAFIVSGEYRARF
ncbi:MAG: hypothetical protein H0U60_10550, partial [Blastocatellia bacterium]|nr:hypothetical protein [Blastocatellia bacterium]